MKQPFFDAFKQIYKDRLKEIHTEKQHLSSELTKTTQKMDGLIDLRIAGELTGEQYKVKSAEFSEKINVLKLKLSALVIQDEGILDIVNKSVELLTNLDQYWNTADNRMKLGIIDMICVELFVDTEKSLKIKENEVFEILRLLNCSEWLPIHYNRRTSKSPLTRLAKAFLQNKEIIEKIHKTLTEIL